MTNRNVNRIRDEVLGQDNKRKLSILRKDAELLFDYIAKIEEALTAGGELAHKIKAESYFKAPELAVEANQFLGKYIKASLEG